MKETPGGSLCGSMLSRQIHAPELVGLGSLTINFQQNAPYAFFESSHLGNLCSKTTKVGKAYFFVGYISILIASYSNTSLI